MSAVKDSISKVSVKLPEGRFALELEFVQALASPAYLHFLATSRNDGDGGLLLQDPSFINFLRYLKRTWSQPEYSRFLSYPHALYFLELLIDKPAFLKELSLPAFRNFCHQQQFLAWQYRNSILYGKGSAETPISQNQEQVNGTNSKHHDST